MPAGPDMPWFTVGVSEFKGASLGWQYSNSYIAS